MAGGAGPARRALGRPLLRPSRLQPAVPWGTGTLESRGHEEPQVPAVEAGRSRPHVALLAHRGGQHGEQRLRRGPWGPFPAAPFTEDLGFSEEPPVPPHFGLCGVPHSYLFPRGGPPLCSPVVPLCSSRVPIVLGARDAGVQVTRSSTWCRPARTPDPPGSPASSRARVGRDVVCPPLRLSQGSLVLSQAGRE